ncbi:MAG: hypothetical protein ACE3JP_10665 [Ectobacillus sp.]
MQNCFWAFRKKGIEKRYVTLLDSFYTQLISLLKASLNLIVDFYRRTLSADGAEPLFPLESPPFVPNQQINPNQH